MADDITVRLDGVGDNLDDFKFGEREWLEDYLGKPLSDDGVLSSKKAALGFVCTSSGGVRTRAHARPEMKLSTVANQDADEPAAEPRPTKRKAAAG
jgi:hypothetical protein